MAPDKIKYHPIPANTLSLEDIDKAELIMKKISQEGRLVLNMEGIEKLFITGHTVQHVTMDENGELIGRSIDMAFDGSKRPVRKPKTPKVI